MGVILKASYHYIPTLNHVDISRHFYMNCNPKKREEIVSYFQGSRNEIDK